MIDSERISLAVDARVLADLGWELSEREIADRFVGRPAGVFEAAVESHLGRRLHPDWEHPYLPWYRAALERDLRPVSGVEAAIDVIEDSGRKTCVASSSSHERLNFTLGLTGLLARFEGRLFSSDDVHLGKPAPDLFELAARGLGFGADECLVVEDSLPGLEAARSAGMRSIAFDGGMFDRSRLEAANPEAVINGMDELAAAVARVA